jgi:hypothetical protein
MLDLDKVVTKLLACGCSHNKMSQKGCQMGFKNSQNWRNIYVLPFKTMAIMTSYSLLIHMNVKEFK